MTNTPPNEAEKSYEDLSDLRQDCIDVFILKLASTPLDELEAQASGKYTAGFTLDFRKDIADQVGSSGSTVDKALVHHHQDVTLSQLEQADIAAEKKALARAALIGDLDSYDPDEAADTEPTTEDTKTAESSTSTGVTVGDSVSDAVQEQFTSGQLQILEALIDDVSSSSVEDIEEHVDWEYATNLTYGYRQALADSVGLTITPATDLFTIRPEEVVDVLRSAEIADEKADVLEAALTDSPDELVDGKDSHEEKEEEKEEETDDTRVSVSVSEEPSEPSPRPTTDHSPHPSTLEAVAGLALVITAVYIVYRAVRNIARRAARVSTR